MIQLDEKLFMTKPIKGRKVHLCREINGTPKYICSWCYVDACAESRQSAEEKELCPLCMHTAIQMGWAIFNHDIWREKHAESMKAYRILLEADKKGWSG